MTKNKNLIWLLGGKYSNVFVCIELLINECPNFKVLSKLLTDEPPKVKKLHEQETIYKNKG